ERKMKENLGLQSLEKVTLPEGTPTSREEALRNATQASVQPATLQHSPPATAPSASPDASSQGKPQQPCARVNPATRKCPWFRTSPNCAPACCAAWSRCW